jgi:hypothetical protein
MATKQLTDAQKIEAILDVLEDNGMTLPSKLRKAKPEADEDA